MPEVFRKFGFVFLFFSKEHLPIHIHAKGKGCVVKVNIKGKNIYVESIDGKIKSNDMRNVMDAIEENRELIIEKWKEYFNK